MFEAVHCRNDGWAFIFIFEILKHALGFFFSLPHSDYLVYILV